MSHYRDLHNLLSAGNIVPVPDSIRTSTLESALSRIKAEERRKAAALGLPAAKYKLVWLIHEGQRSVKYEVTLWI